MPSTVLVGAQWGDEGKGKITDLIASDYDYVVRFQGGNNAGHTVIHGDKKLALHLMPSGVMYENAVPVIGNGVVVVPQFGDETYDERALETLREVFPDRAVVGVASRAILMGGGHLLQEPAHLQRRAPHHALPQRFGRR